ncbi:uncharacterized protein LOC119083923 [Bradysia coprophila]|uniref:uncharacterized protein LOC119083923 n=1 Tax=Bradysia coprophila TaxID=38358 RepID=UPI00187DD587|nr:uncharacterized protein LOC119083923 [Bradysia coprophila]
MVVVIVPHARPYSHFAVYFQNATCARHFVYAFIVIVSSSVLLIVSGYLREKKFLLFKSVVDAANLLMNDNAGIRYGNLHRADVFVIVPLTLTGIIVMNSIVSLLQSFITSPIYQPQINSLHDLYESSVQILEDKFRKDKTVELLENRTGFGEWSGKVQGIYYDQRTEAIETFQNSIAFLATDSNTNSYLEVQKRLGLEAFHTLRDTFFSKQLMAYMVEKEFPYKECLSDIVHRLNGAGLIEKWNNDELLKYTKSLLNRNRKSQLVNASNKIEFVVPTVVWCGWIASGVVFICELIWNLKKKLLSGKQTH